MHRHLGEDVYKRQQVYNLYNNYVLSTGDVLSTYIYRISLGLSLIHI